MLSRPNPTDKVKTAGLLVIALLLMSGCTAPLPGDGSVPLPSPTPLFNPSPTPFFSLQVYFTDPLAPGAGSYQGGPDTAVVQSLDAASRSIDMAMYNLSLQNVADALVHARMRGVQVRLVMDSDAMDKEVPQSLMAAEIPIVGDRSEALMHNKFIVIDSKEVWSGSLNLTYTGTYKDNNNFLHIVNPIIAADYTAEFEEMFRDDSFGAGSPANTPYPLISIDGTRVEVLFSPDDGVLSRLVTLMENADESIEVLAYSFTSDRLTEAILERAREGVRVRGVFETNKARSDAGAEYDRFLSAGVDMRLDANAGLMHHKVLLIDHEIVVLGSYNFTDSAERRNDENLLIIHDPKLAGRYLLEFEKLFQTATR